MTEAPVLDETAERNKELVRAGINAAWNERTWDPERYAEDIVVHAPTQPEPYRGRDEFKQMWQDLTTAYEDFHMEILDLFGEGHRCGVRFLVTGTNTGEYFGMPATGRSLRIEELAIFHFSADGKMQEIWFGLDSMEVGKQLGMIPDGPPPKALIAFMRFTQKLKRKR